MIREHHRGRTLAEILDDHYVTNRLGPEQIRRLLDREDVVHAIGEDTIASIKDSVVSQTSSQAARARGRRGEVPRRVAVRLEDGDVGPGGRGAAACAHHVLQLVDVAPVEQATPRPRRSDRRLGPWPRRPSRCRRAPPARRPHRRARDSEDHSRRPRTRMRLGRRRLPCEDRRPCGRRRDDDVAGGDLVRRAGLRVVDVAEGDEPLRIRAHGRSRGRASAGRGASPARVMQPAARSRRPPGWPGSRSRDGSPPRPTPQPSGARRGARPREPRRAPRDGEEDDQERRTVGRPDVGLEPCVAKAAVDARHHREHAVRQRQPLARAALDLTARQAEQRRLDSRERLSRRQDSSDLALRDVPHALMMHGPRILSRCGFAAGAVLGSTDGGTEGGR